MGMGQQLVRATLRFIHRFEDALLVSALVAMLLMALIQIGLRNIFDAGLFWAEPLLRILVLWVAMLGAMVATRESNHISIDILSRYLGSAQKKAVQLVTSLFSAAVCCTVAYFSFEFVGFEYEDKTIAFADVPTWICQSIIPVGFLVMSIRFLVGGLSGAVGNRP